MNKYCYRLIFSRTHGELRVVSELARSCSTEPGQSRGGGAPRLWVTLRRVVWLFGLALFAGPAVAGGIVADGGAAAGQRPDVMATQNGLPQVNITAPNQAGVSHNQYRQFDVDQNGAILNNSATMTQTQMAGMIQGNPNLKPNSAPARVILNEVNSNDPSQLRGFLEVAGGKAQVIVANPAGILCNGCGTINAGRMTLTTGKPQLNADGSLSGYQVERGVVRVEGGGLNGDVRHDTEYVDILARAVEVNAGVWAKEGIRVVAGRNRISAEGNAVTPLAADGKAPELAIDMGQMGGMYSGQIRMIGTEAGVGVRNQGGQLQAGKTLAVSSEGKLSWQSGAHEALTQAAGDISLAARGDVEHHGKLHSGGNLAVQSREGELKQSGTLAAAGNLRLEAAHGIQSSGHLLAGSDTHSTLTREADLTLASQGDIRAGGSLLSKKDVSLTGRRVDLSGGTLAAGRATIKALGGGVALRQAKVDSAQLGVSAQGDIDAQQAQVRAGNWDVNADSLFNQGAIWSQVGAGESRFSLTGQLDNSDGSIEARQLNLNTAALNNLRGRLVALDGAAQHWQISGQLDNHRGELGSNGSLTLDTGALNNQAGTLRSQTALQVNSGAGIDNAQGKLLAGGSLALNAAGAIDNRGGEINAQALNLQAQRLSNVQGKVIGQQTVNLNADQSLDNTHGLLEAGGVLALNTGGDWDNRGGIAQGGKQADVTARSLNNAGGRLQSGGALALTTAGDVINQTGTLTAKEALVWQGGAHSLFDNTTGTLLSGGAMSLQGDQLTNRQQGVIQSEQALRLALTGVWDNQSGKLTGGGRTLVRAGSLLNAQGNIQTLDSLDMQFTGALDNANGRVFSRLSQSLQAKDIFNVQGWMGSQGSWVAVGSHFDNHEGSVQSQQDATLTANTLDNLKGSLTVGASLVLSGLKAIDNRAGKIGAQGRLDVQGSATGNVNNAGGQLLAGESLAMAAQSVDNRQGGLIYSQKQIRLALTGQLDNRQGKLQSGEGLQLDALSLQNEAGSVDSQQQLGLRILGLLDNAGGAVRSNGDQQITAGQADNRQGVFSSRGALALTAARLDNAGGTLISQGTGVYRVGVLHNQQGKVHSGDALTLLGEQVNNRAGQLVSTGGLRLNAAQLDNSAEGRISSLGQLDVQTDGLNNRDGGLLLGTTHTAVSARSMDNRAGRLQSAGSLALSGLEAVDNRQGRILANKTLTLNEGTPSALALLNQGGTIQSGESLTVNTRTLDNQGGTLLSRQALRLTVQQDYTHRAGDTLNSNDAVALSVAGVLTNLADWLLPGSLTLNSTDFINQGSLVGKVLQLTTGMLINQGRLEADGMTLNVDSLDNTAALMGDDITVSGRVIDNHGQPAVIAATQVLTLQTGDRLSNRDGALIYSGDRLYLRSDDLIENRASFIEADGDVHVEAKRLDNLREGLEIARDAQSSDYKWQRYNYYWRSFGEDVNTDVGTMAPTTQQLTLRNDAAAQDNRYGTLLAIDASGKRAQVRVKDHRGQLTDLWINYLALKPNADGSYAMTFYETRGQRQKAVPTPYQNTVWWNATDSEKVELWDPERFIDIANVPYVTDYNNLRERTATGTVTRDKLVNEGIGAHILAGGNLVLRITGQLFNDASTVSANGNLAIEGDGKIVNKGYSVNERRQEYIVDHYDRAEGHWYPTFNRDETTALTTVDGIITGNGNVSIQGAGITNTTVNQAQISSVEAAQKAAEAERAEWERNPLAVRVEGGGWQAGDTQLAPGSRPLTPAELALTDKQHLGSVATTVPNNALFRQEPTAGSPFLVVTDERFTSRSQFISSDYLLSRVGYDPAQTHKRLGDGYYEQRLVRDQVLKLTGRPSVRGEDAMAQYQSLMNNGIKVAQDFHLVPGVALTPAQIAALQQDMVWMVSETVDTANGPQTLWVPKVYLAHTTLRLTGDGALIGGGNLQLSANSLNNAGNLFADQALKIDAGQFLHQGGDIKADSIDVRADSLTLSTNLQDALRQATLSANDISLSGTDIRLQGAKLDATQNLSLSAQNNLDILAAKSSHTANLEVISGAMGNRTRDGLEEAGGRMAQVSGEWQQTLGSQLNAGGNLSLKAGQDINLQGSQAKAGGQLGVQAGGDVKLVAETATNKTQLEANSSTSSVSNRREEDRVQLSTLSGDKGVTLLAGNTLLAEGAQVDSQAGRVGLGADNVVIREARRQTGDQDSEQKREGKTHSQREMQTFRDQAIGSTFSGQNGVTVIAREGDIAVTGSTLHSEQGAIALQAKKDVTLNSATERESQFTEEHVEKKGLLSTSSSHRVKDDRITREKGALLSGDSVSITAGNDLAITGSAIAADRDVNLQAGNNIAVTAATETESHSLLEEKKKSGLLSSGGIGFTVGSQSSRHQVDESGTTQSQSASTVGSSQGNVTITAGNQLHIGGAALIAGKDLSLSGSSVLIDPGYDQRTREEKFESKQSGLTLALSGTVGSALNTAVSTAQQANKESDGRLSALQGTKAALSGVQAVQAGRMDAAKGNDPSNNNTVGVSLSYGSQSSSSTQTSGQSTAQGSSLQAGNNLSIRATEGDITVQGSQLQAGKDLSLDAARDVNLLSAKNTEYLDGRNASQGGTVGVGIGVGSGGWGISVSASVNKGRGSESGNGTTHTETTVNAGNQVSITSGRDTTLKGAQVNGETVKADVGRNLTLTSEQDSDRYDARQQSASAGGSFTFGSMTGSGSVNVSQDKLHSNYDSVKEQTGIFAGKGGFDITVGEHTQLDGAVIGSTAVADKNRLDTGTLGFTDIHNQADFKGEHQSAGFSSGGAIGSQFAGNAANNLLAGANNSGSASSTTQSAVSSGTLIIRDQNKQQQNVDDLSRDVEHANQTLSPIFDKEKEQNRLKAAQLIGEVGSQAADIARTEGDIRSLTAGKAELAKRNPPVKEPGEGATKEEWKAYNDKLQATDSYKATQKQWGTGSSIQQGISAATAAVQGLAGGDIAKAIAGGSAPYLAEVIHNMTTDLKTGKVNTEANLMAHAVVGAVVAQASGNSAAAGAAGAVSGELMAQLVMSQLYPGKGVSELTEDQKQTISALGTLAAGLAGGLAGNGMADTVAGAQAGQNSATNNFLSSKDALSLHKELEEADKTGADKQDIYEKYAEVSKKNREEAVAEGCSGNPFCANGALSEAGAGSDIANSLKRLPLFSGLSSDDLAQLDRFVLAENEDSARAIYQAMPDYVKVALNGKEAVEAIGLGAAVGGKALAALGVVGKAGKQPYEPNQGAVGNMGEFFKQSGFGEQAKSGSQKTSKIYQGQTVYKVSGDVGDNLRKGDQFYLDAEHKNHLEVFDKRNKFVHVINLDGSINVDKTKKAAAEGRILPK
ncbi:hemagglutinin repeat-containing protein [Serratia inhibens]|uniref:hemagglutinin repeat-containing protein n=1 Tax=Serratia inhibens TaxID=2338073 RepID=UPI0008097AF1|nr:hemagglutinin repeat-containing protein [Serratia inhibens]ANS44140.1 16S rRNA endonuclease CdiA [Serratia inhibens PRI-2C]